MNTPNLIVDSEFLESLPADPESGFALLEGYLRQRIPIYEEHSYDDRQHAADMERAEYQRQYILNLGAFADVNGLEVGVNFDHLMGLHESQFIQEFRSASTKIQYYANKCAFKLNTRKKAGSTCIYVLSSSARVKIHAALNNLRGIISEAEITDAKREALLVKLNNFAMEVDLDRTRLESLASMYAQVKAEAAPLKAAAEKIESIFRTVGTSGKELWRALPSLEITARIEGPRKKLEAPKDPTIDAFELDDEIPF